MTGTAKRDVEWVLDRASDGYVSVDAHGRVDWINSRAAEMLSLSRPDVLDRPVEEAFPELADTGIVDRFQQATESETPSRFRAEFAPTGEYFEMRAYPDEDGGLSVFLRDVTEPRRMGRELALNATIVEAVHDAVIAFDGDGTVTSVNEAAEELLGTDRPELVGAPLGDLSAVTALDDGDAAAFEEAVTAVGEGEESQRRFRVTCDHDAGPRIGEVQIVPLPVDDIGGTVGVIREVTERREHERIVTALHDVSRRLFGADSSDEICAIAVEAAANLLDLGLSGTWLLDEEQNRLEPIAATAQTHDEVGGLPHFAEHEGLIWDAFRSGEPALYEDLREVSGLYNPHTPIRSELIVPIGSHGVLMTGELKPGQFDETDRELAGILAANVEAALDRTDRERLLRRRRSELERERDRLGTVADVLSQDIEQRIEAAREALPAGGEGPAASAEDELATAERLVADVREVAGAASSEPSRTRVSLAAAAADAADRVEGVTVRSLADPTLRVDRSRFVRFLATFLRFAAVRADGAASIHVGLVEGQTGFYVADDGPPLELTERSQVCDPEYAASLDLPGLGPALAAEIAAANGWNLSLARPENDENESSAGARFEVTDVTTLSR
jgi:PAS domain S-box-containing protein